MLRTVQSMVTYLEKFPVEREIATCARAHYFGSYTWTLGRATSRGSRTGAHGMTTLAARDADAIRRDIPQIMGLEKRRW